MTEETIKEGKTLAIVSYFWFFGVLIAFYLNKDKTNNPFTLFHARQSLGIWVSAALLSFVIRAIDSISASIFTWFLLFYWIIFFLFFLFGIITAANGKMKLLPLVGALYQRLFGQILK